MKRIALFLLSVWSSVLASTLMAAPLVEVNNDTLQLPLAPYVDVLEDKTGGLMIEDVTSERYAFQFAPASVTELFFGYSTSAYWMRVTIENQRDEDMRFILEASPADIDYLDLYTVDPQSNQLLHHVKLGSATPYNDRAYDSPLNLFDIKIEAHKAYTYYLRAESDKAINIKLLLSTPHEYMALTNVYEWCQGMLLGGLSVAAVLFLGLFLAYRFRAFLWHGLTLACVVLIQAAWHGDLLRFYDSNDTLLDHQIMMPIYLSLLFSSLFAQSLLKTRRRSLWQHGVLTVMAVLSLLGSISTWFISPHVSALIIDWLASLNILFVFAAALHANMDEYPLARPFIIVRAVTAGVVLISIFNVSGYLPQGSFTMWGIAAALIVEAVVMAVAMVKYCIEQQRKDYIRANVEPAQSVSQRQFVNLSDICHELRTPISGVLGMTELLLTGNVTEQQRSQIKTIDKSGHALLDVANKLSDLSSIEKGNLELNSEPFELMPIMESCIESCRGRAEHNNIELIYHVDGAIVGFVKGDHNKLQHIIINLLQFALRNVEQGEVVLSVKGTSKDSMAFSIQSGMNTLTERNTPTDTSRFHSSDHLNLTIAEQYIKLLGGTLDLQSYAGGGVSIQFALSFEEHFNHAAPVGDDAALQGRRLLIVDDNATCCAIIEQQATQWGMHAQSTYSGKEALAILRSYTTLDEPFDVVLIDYEMPGMDGLELAAHIRDDEKINRKQLTVIMLTGVSRAPAQPVLDEVRIFRVLHKPLSGKSLKQTLQSILAAKERH